jgi:A/G-specific adenine glycosylase
LGQSTRRAGIDTPLPAARAAIRAELERLTPAAAGDFAQGLMDLAGRICTPRAPRCDNCPIAVGCRAAASGDPTRWPVKPIKKPRPLRHGFAWWIEADGAVLTVTRPPKGLLGGMVALPSGDWSAAPDPAPPMPGDWIDLGAVSHGFTHFELLLRVRALRLAARPPLAGNWLNVDEMASAGLPTLFRKAVSLAMAHESGSEDQ